MRWAMGLAAGIACAVMSLAGEVKADWGGLARPNLQMGDDRFVLRAAGLPRAFTAKIIEADAETGALDTDAQVASLTQADVWVIGVEAWDQTEWLKSSPIYGLFAQRLHATAPGTPYRLFNWTLKDGRQIDLYFVHLGHAEAAGQACMASTIYALSRSGIAARRATAAAAWDKARAQPIVRGHTSRGAFCD